MLLEELKLKGIEIKLCNNNTINVKSKIEIPNDIVKYLKKNKQRLILELKKEKAQAIKQMEEELANSIKPDTFLNVQFEGFDRLVAICHPEDEEYLQKQGLLTLTTKELTILTIHKSNNKTLINLLKIKESFGGTIASCIYS